MVTMHVWFLHKRLVSSHQGLDPDWAHAIQDELFRILWNDTLCRIRQQGVYEMSVEKNLIKVQKYTFLHMFHYDHIYKPMLTLKNNQENQEDMTQPPPQEHDQEFQPWDPLSVIDHKANLTRVQDRISELKKLVWMHVMVRDEKTTSYQDQLERMAWYVETQFQNIIMEWPTEHVREARVAWVNLPSFANLKDDQGRVLAPRPVDLNHVLPDPWLTNITLRGETYYWNPVTRQSQWEHPTTGQTTEKR
jgi:WW domain/Ubiquinol-cytochrome C chaperone